MYKEHCLLQIAYTGYVQCVHAAGHTDLIVEAGIGHRVLLMPEAPAVTRHADGYWVVPSLAEILSLLG